MKKEVRIWSRGIVDKWGNDKEELHKVRIWQSGMADKWGLDKEGLHKVRIWQKWDGW